MGRASDEYLKELAARRRKQNILKARKKSLESGKGCLICPASVLCLSGADIVITRCSCGVKTVRIDGQGRETFVRVGPDIECWAVMTTSRSCDYCRGELVGDDDVVMYTREKFGNEV